MVAGREDADLLMPNLKVGVSTNFNKLCACLLMDLVDPNLYLTLLPEAMKKVEAEFNKSAIVKLYDEVDFIGISSYAGECGLVLQVGMWRQCMRCGVSVQHAACRLPLPLLPAALKGSFLLPDLEDAIRQFDVELAQFGPNLQELIHKKGKVRRLLLTRCDAQLPAVHITLTSPAPPPAQALILSEYGVGGGIAQNGSVAATTADEAASLPFFGIFGSYNPATGWCVCVCVCLRVRVRSRPPAAHPNMYCCPSALVQTHGRP
jgi:hypothetical protein